MKKKVFISWSGRRGQACAECISVYLKKIDHSLDPFVASRDILPGEEWLDKTLDQLRTASIGIVCITKEALGSNWVFFESGALSSAIERRRLIVVLIDIHRNNLPSPLNIFQAVGISRRDMLSVVKQVSLDGGNENLSEVEIVDNFDEQWDRFNSDLVRCSKTKMEGDFGTSAFYEAFVLETVDRELSNGNLDYVLEFLNDGMRENAFEPYGRVFLAEAALSRLGGKRGSKRNLLPIIESSSSLSQIAILERGIIDLSLPRTHVSALEDWIKPEFIESDLQPVYSAVMALSYLRYGEEDAAREIFRLCEQKHIHKGAIRESSSLSGLDHYGAIFIGVLSFCMGDYEKGEIYFDLAKSSAPSSQRGYPYSRVSKSLDQLFVGKCIGLQNIKYDREYVKHLRGQSWTIIELSKIFRSSELALSGLVEVSKSFPKKKPLSTEGIVGRLKELDDSLQRIVGDPLTPL